ncbi:MAG: UDP-N-acetylmuramoyl-tripeptide--D-alanyl-D-alanine ligase [Thermoleophilaceae bacterium]
MIDRSPDWIAEAVGGRIEVAHSEASGPRRAVVDSRLVEPGDLFVALPGERSDGADFAVSAIEAGAWGALVSVERASSIAAETVLLALSRPPPRGGGEDPPPAAVIGVTDPLAALAALARAWRRELDCPAIGITGSTGKTSTKDILAALLRPHLRTHANRENLNTEIGLPLSILCAERGTEALVREMAMRGEDQIAELTRIAEPNVGVVVNVGPVHLELLGTVERVAAAKAELIRDLPAGASCVVRAGERLLAEHLREDLDTLTFGPGGDVSLASFEEGRAEIDARGERIELELSYTQPHNLLNTLAAVAAATAIGVRPEGPVEVAFSSMRGQEVELPSGVTVVNDCYNANPMSVRAALEHLAASPAERRLAVLGVMAELGPDAERLHEEVGERAAELGIDVLVTVGPGARGFARRFGREAHAVEVPEEAAALLEEIAAPGDRVLIKGSRSAGLERVLGTI